MPKFSSRAWCLPRDEFIGIGAVVVCPALVVGRFWICIYVCAYIFLYIFICASSCSGCSCPEGAGSLPRWVMSVPGGQSGPGPLQDSATWPLSQQGASSVVLGII